MYLHASAAAAVACMWLHTSAAAVLNNCVEVSLSLTHLCLPVQSLRKRSAELVVAEIQPLDTSKATPRPPGRHCASQLQQQLHW